MFYDEQIMVISLSGRKINIVLVEPQIPQNTGNIARTCAATNTALHIVRPMGFTVDDKKLRRAGLDYWYALELTYYDSLSEFFRKTAGEYFYFTTKGKRNYSDVRYDGNVFILFGREDKGLDEALLHDNVGRCVRIPMGEGMRSLNLSNSVAIATYEILRQWGFPGLQGKGRLTKFSDDIF